jgi:hypothetical protein
MAFYFRINYCSCGFADNASVALCFFLGETICAEQVKHAIVFMGYMIHLFNVIDTPAHLSFAQ